MSRMRLLQPNPHADRCSRIGCYEMNSVTINGNNTQWQKILSRNRWVLGVWLLLGVLLLWYSTLIPVFGEFQVTSITKNSLPLVYLAIGQAIIVIGGGIDLSVGSLLLLGNVIAARFMEDQSLGVVFMIGLGMILVIGILNGFTGYIISVSKIPDIVVTLATSYIWSGIALLILGSPGGGTAPEVRWLFSGSVTGIGGSPIMPIIMLVIPTFNIYVLESESERSVHLCDREQCHCCPVNRPGCAQGKGTLLCNWRSNGFSCRVGYRGSYGDRRSAF